MAGQFVAVSVIFSLCLSMVHGDNIGSDRQDINLHSDGGYTDLLVGISKLVDENAEIIQKLKVYFMEASKVLLLATRNRLYFRNITIIVPSTWTNQPMSVQAEVNETFERARVIVGQPNLEWGDVPYTLQPGSCGAEGDYIHFTPDYLLKDPTTDSTHRPAKRIVREFAHLKWGLFDEDVPIKNTNSSKFYQENEEISPIKCSKKLNGKEKDPSAPKQKCQFNKTTSLYTSSCQFLPVPTTSGGSLLNFEYLEKTMNFCDSTGAVVHDKVPRNEQNTHCNGKSAWEVMSTLSDFQTDYNASRNGQAPPNITFRLVQHQSPPTTQIVTATIATTSSGSIGKELAPKCDQDIVCLCLDVSSSMRGDRIETMSHSAQAYIISFLKEGAAVGIVAFASSARTVVGMTVITSTATRSWLADQVPTTSGGSTGIGSGLKKCHEMLRNYAGSEIGKTRIFLLSDGGENTSPAVADVLPSIREDGIVVDTVLYGQSAVSYSIDEITGGLNMFISDMTGKVGLDLFFAETANGRCEASSDEAIVNNEEIVLGPGKSAYSDIIYFDKTIGVNTKLVFKYQGDINVTVSTPENHTVIINPYPKSQIIDAVIVGQVKREVHYTITKLGHLDRTVSVVTSITSNLVPGVEPITIKNRVNNDNIQFSKDSEIINYVGVFQGLTPISGLTINMLMEQPDGSVTVVKLADDGTGKDSIANDGIYTGFTPSHNIRGQGFFSSKVVVSGEGKLPDSASVAPGTRRKRCVGCDISLGNITRTTTGKVVVVNNWIVVPDSTPPQKITDAEILSAVSEKQIFTIGWTAPGDDLNLGQVALYEFAVSINISRSQLVSLPAEAILSNVSAYVVPAGTKLELMINTSKINSTIFGLDEAADVSTYYIRIRAADAAGNVAEWSNPVSVTYIDPSRYITPVVFPEVSSDGPAAKGSTAAMAMVLVRPLLPSMLEIW